MASRNLTSVETLERISRAAESAGLSRRWAREVSGNVLTVLEMDRVACSIDGGDPLEARWVVREILLQRIANPGAGLPESTRDDLIGIDVDRIVSAIACQLDPTDADLTAALNEATTQYRSYRSELP